MPNWCSNALSINTTDNNEQLVIESLFNGSFENRIDELTGKLRKIFMAGIGRVLVPHSNTPEKLLQQVAQLKPELYTNVRANDSKSEAYTEFLELLVNGCIFHHNFENLSELYDRTGLSNLWWGDITRIKRNRMKKVWKSVSYDFSSTLFMDIASWWTKANLYENKSVENILDMRLLKPLPISTAINGFNGRALTSLSAYDWNREELGTKWPEFEVYELHNGNYEFSTAWSPVIPIIELIPEFLSSHLKVKIDEIKVDCQLAYYEPGCAFQGINYDTDHLVSYFDEENDEAVMGLLPEVREIFGE